MLKNVKLNYNHSCDLVFVCRVEEVAEPWIEGLWEALKKELCGRQWNQANENTMTTGRDPVVGSKGCIDNVEESEFIVTNTNAVSDMSSPCHIK